MLIRPTLFALLLSLLLTACSPTDATDVSQAGDPTAATAPSQPTLRVALRVMPATLDPAEELSASYLRSLGANESLLRIAADGSVAPALATGIERRSPTEWAVTLPENLRFWSGTAVDADAVVASLERSRELSPLAEGLLGEAQLEATDPATVLITTPEVMPSLPVALSHYMFGIHNTAAFDDAEGTTDVDVADLAGPLRVIDFASARAMVLEPAAHWNGDPLQLDRVEVQEVGDDDARAQLALSGQADLVQDIPAIRAAEVEQAEGMQVVAAPAANTVTVYLNPSSTDAPALADQRVREALAWAVDRQGVVDLATGGLSVPAPSWLASSAAYPDAAQQGFVGHDPDRAAELLDDAGWVLDDDGIRRKDGEPLGFRLMTFGLEARTGEVLQAQWAEIGAEVALSNVESTLITQSIERDDWDAVTQAWTTLGAMPGLISAQIGPDGAANHGGHTPPEVPALIETATSAEGEAARAGAVYALNQVMVDVVSGIPVHPRVQATAVSDAVEGFIPHPLQYENLVQLAMSLRE